MRTTAATLSILLSGVLLCGSAWAGLATDGNAYVDSEGFVWHGSTDFIGEGLDEGLTATVEWCVYYGPDDYPGTDYVPDADEFVYAYQVFVAADSAQITKFSVGMYDSNEANDIGADETLVSGTVPSSAFFTNPPPNLDTANWLWSSGLATDTQSRGLVYSSVNAPLLFIGSIQDGGKQVAGDLPSPSDVIPEPATMVLLAAGLLGLLRRRR
jgi:hypothetical protein